MPLSDEDLPHRDDPLWAKRRKIRVVAAVRSGILPLHLALERFNISAEEFVQWEHEVGQDLARKRQIFRDTKAGRGPRVASRRPRHTT
jgi:hypothetical protein